MTKYIYVVNFHTHKLEFIVTSLVTTSSTKPKVIYNVGSARGLSYSVFAANRDASFINFYNHLN